MSRRISPGGATRKRPPVIFVFGENPSDSTSIKELVLLHRPDLDGRVQVKRNPASLTRQAGTRPVLTWVDKMREVIKAAERSGQEVVAVLVHRDADCIDKEGKEEEKLATQLADLHKHVLPVVPVVMMESWWLLFPVATESVRPKAWRDTLLRSNRNTDLVEDPKSELMSRTARSGSKYAEADGPSIAGAIRVHRSQPSGSSPSYARFVKAVNALPRSK